MSERRVEWDNLRLEWKALTEAAPLMMWITEPDGYCIHLNQHWYEFTGQARRAGEGDGWLEAVHPDDRAGAFQDFSEANSKRVAYSTEYRLRHRSGVFEWVWAKATPYFDARGIYRGYIGADTSVALMIQTHSKTQERLSARERQVVQLIARGLTSEEVGHELGIDLRTADAHMQRAAAKLGTSNRVHTVVTALKLGEIAWPQEESSYAD